MGITDCQYCLEDSKGICSIHERALAQDALMKDPKEKGPVKITDRTALYPTMPFYSWISARGD